MADDIQNANTGAPPKLVIRRKTESEEVPPTSATPEEADSALLTPTLKKKTTRIDLSSADILALAKKSTARIPLEAASPSTLPATGILSGTTDGTPKTIRLKRPAQAVVPSIDTLIKSQKLAEPEADKASLKKKTSRISLESALTLEDTSSAQSTPEEEVPQTTIRIKRPEGTGVAPDPKKSESSFVLLDDQPTIAKSQTARIELPPSAMPAAESAAPTTQRKTIKIRRPDGAVSLSIQRPSAESPATLKAAAVEQAAKPLTKMGLVWEIVFGVAGLAAIIITAIVIYILMTQASPSSSLTFPGQVTL